MKKKFVFVASYIQKVEGMPEKVKRIKGIIKAPDANTAGESAQELLTDEFGVPITIERTSPSPIREVLVASELDSMPNLRIEVTLRGTIKDEELGKAVTINFTVLMEVPSFGYAIKVCVERFQHCSIRQLKVSSLDWYDGSDINLTEKAE